MINFLNIAGGLAAGAQRADELEAKLAASKSKTDPAQALIAKIIPTGWLQSKEAIDKGITTQVLNNSEIPALQDFWAKGVKYKEKQDVHTNALETVGTLRGDGAWAEVIDNQVVAVPAIPTILKNQGMEIKDGNYTSGHMVQAYQTYKDFLSSTLIEKYGGYKNIPLKVLQNYISFSYGALDRIAKTRSMAFNIPIKDDEDIIKTQLPFALDRNGMDIDPTKTNALVAQLKSMYIFGNRNQIEGGKKLTPAAATAQANKRENIFIPRVSNDQEIPSHVQPIINAHVRENSQNPETQDSVVDGKPVYGTQSIHNRAKIVITTQGAAPRAVNDFVLSVVDRTDDAEQITMEADPFTILNGMMRRYYMPKETMQITDVGGGVSISHPVKVKDPEKEKLDAEESITAKLYKSSGTVSSTIKQVERIQAIMMDAGLFHILSQPMDLTKKDNIIHNLGLSVKLTRELELQGAIERNEQGQPVVTDRGAIERAFNNLRVQYDGLTEAQKRQIRLYGSESLANMPAGIASLWEKIKANIHGTMQIIGVNQVDKYISWFTGDEDNFVAIDTATSTLNREKPGLDFNKLIANERTTIKDAHATMERHKSDMGSEMYLRAQAAARLAFSKIQLAYTYAAIAQGGEGSARTISDTDFAKSIEALFSSQGKGLVGVMADIRRQLLIEQDALDNLMTFNGTGKLHRVAKVFRKVGQEYQRVKDLREGAGRGAAGPLEITTQSVAEKAATPEAVTEAPDEAGLNLAAESPLRAITGSNLGDKKSQGILYKVKVLDDEGETKNASFRFKYVDNSEQIERNFRQDIENELAPALFQELYTNDFITTKEGLDTQEGLYALTDALLNDDAYMQVFKALEMGDIKELKIRSVVRGLAERNAYNVLVAAAEAYDKDGSEWVWSDWSADEVAGILIKGVLKYMYQYYDAIKERAEKG